MSESSDSSLGHILMWLLGGGLLWSGGGVVMGQARAGSFFHCWPRRGLAMWPWAATFLLYNKRPGFELCLQTYSWHDCEPQRVNR